MKQERDGRVRCSAWLGRCVDWLNDVSLGRKCEWMPDVLSVLALLISLLALSINLTGQPLRWAFEKWGAPTRAKASDHPQPMPLPKSQSQPHSTQRNDDANAR